MTDVVADPLTPDDIVEIEILDLAPRGDGTAVGDDGKPVYVAGGIPGERVRARVYRRGKRFAGADLLEIVRPSPHRVTPPCPLFGHCNGCQLQHVSAEHQLVLKRDLVLGELRTTGGFTDPVVLPTLAAPDPWGYRNHARFTVRHGHIGFVRRQRRAFFVVDHCMIMEPRINALVTAMQGRVAETTQCNIRVGAPDDAVSIQPRLTLTDIDSGQTHVTERLGGHDFQVSNAAFFQVHRAQAERMLALVCEWVRQAPPGLVVDAYAGVGTFAAALADDGRQVIAIEESGPAVRDAALNLAAQPAISLRLGRSELILATMADEQLEVAALVLDPPRSGCLPGAIDAVARLRPSIVVYVSCDPATLARDLRMLCDRGFELVQVQPLDMFPQTIHIECIAVLRRVEFADTAS